MNPLDEMIRRARALEDAESAIAKEAAPRVLAALQATARAGTTPTGKPWPATKEGGRALVNAASHLAAKALGSVVKVTLTGVDVIHNAGTGWIPKRRILPETGEAVPPVVAKAVEDAARAVLGRIASGGTP